MSSETIKIFMVDGIMSGITTAEIMNWTGSVVSSPISRLSDLKKRDELKRSGCYVLLGEDKVYIGESETIIERWKDPNHPIISGDFTKVIVITSKDSNLTKAHIKYLEAKLIDVASKVNKMQLKNGTTQQKQLENHLPESDTADMDNFLKKLLIVLPALGVEVFSEPLTSRKSESDCEETQNFENAEILPIFIYRGTGFEAKAQEINGQFTVLKNSIARYKWGSANEQRKVLRDNLIERGVLQENSLKNVKHYLFTQNYAFSSPTAAATVVGGLSNVAGPAVWKTAEKISYKQWIEEKIKQIN